MTTDEMFQLLIDKFTNLENKVDANHNLLMDKIDANHKEVTDKLQDLQVQINETKIAAVGTRADVIELREDVKGLDKQSNIVRVLDKSVPSLHTRVSDMEDEIKEIKDRLDKAS